jgi:3-methyladenine DNA glycosylase AlkD
VKQWPLAQRNRFCTELWKSGRLEDGSVAIEVYRRFAKQCGSAEFRLFEKWLGRFVSNWGACDGVSCCLLAACIQNAPELTALLVPWTKSPTRWKRRAAAVALVREARRGRNTAAIFQIAGLLMEDPEDMVQKGMGWLLKETYPTSQKRCCAFSNPGETGRHAWCCAWPPKR